MKRISAIILSASVALAWAGNPSPTPAAVVKGVVLETRDAAGYTYLRLNTRDGEYWAAVNRTPIGKGAEVTLENILVMTNFESKSLKKTFPTILFGSLAGGTAPALAAPAAPARPAGARVDKAVGANARTVEEVVVRRAELKDKSVQVRARVVRYNPGIMGRNWLHLRDGTGTEAAHSDDLLVTSSQEAKVGEVVTAQGIVRVDKDFGSGYAYQVLVEQATLKR